MPPARENRRDQIIEVTAALFVEQGYNATSIRQIADAVNCTEAALYYHFQNKRDLLQAVLTAKIPNLATSLENLHRAPTLRDLVKAYNQIFRNIDSERTLIMRWLLSEFPRFSDEERGLIHDRFHTYHNTLSLAIGRFIPDAERASHLAWLLICTGFGYGQLCRNLGVPGLQSFPPDQMIELLADLVSGYE